MRVSTRKSRARKLLPLVLGVFLLALLPQRAFAIGGPVTVGTTTNALANYFTATQTQIRECGDKYTYYFWYDGTNQVYSSTLTPTSSTWSPKTTVITSPYGFAGNGYGGLAVYCDLFDNNIFIAYPDSSGNWDFRPGTVSGGVITWSASPTTLACVNAVCVPTSIYCFDTTHCWVGVNDGQDLQADVWDCQTSSCNTGAHWAISTFITTATYFGGADVLGLVGNQKIAAVVCYSACGIITTTNGGSSWSALVAMSPAIVVSSFLNYIQCVAVANTVYCGGNVGGSGVTHPHLLAFPLGALAWTDSNSTKESGTGPSSVALSTDGFGDFVLAFGDAHTLTTIDSVATHDNGSTWAGLTPIVGETGYASTQPVLQADPLYESGAMALGWQAKASSPYNMRFAETDSGGSNVIVNLYAQNFPSLTVMGAFILIFLGVFLIPFMLTAIFKEEGDVVVTLWLFGSFLGALLGSFAATEADILNGSYGYVPWGITFYLAVALVVWLVKGGGH